MPFYTLDTLRSLSREFDLFEPGARDWTRLAGRGLLPPLPVAGGALVWGFPLLEAAGRAGRRELECVELPGGDRAELLATALRLENRAGAYGPDEQARLHAFLADAGLADDPERAAEVVGLITPQKPAAWLKEMKELAGLPAALKRLVGKKLLDVKTAARVRSLPPEFFERLEKESGRFSHSERRRFALLLWEISRRDRLGADETAALAGGLLAEKDPWTGLRARRYPEFEKLAARFAALTAELERAGVTVRPPEWFEGEEFAFTFTATSRAVYERKLAALARFEEQVDRLFELL